MENFVIKTLTFKIFAIFLFITSSQVIAGNRCAENAKIFIASAKTLPDYLQKHVELIWYPKSGTIFTSHTDIQIDDTIYSAFLGVKERNTFKKAHASATRDNTTRGFYRFRLAVSNDEYDNIKNFVADDLGKIRIQTCVSGACRILRNNSSINIPFPFSHVPTLNALYLTMLKKMGYKKIVQVDYFGPNALQNLLSRSVLIELSGVGAVIGLSVWAINEYGVLEHLIVPITNEALEKKEE
jgi:hypothetical protein